MCKWKRWAHTCGLIALQGLEEVARPCYEKLHPADGGGELSQGVIQANNTPAFHHGRHTSRARTTTHVQHSTKTEVADYPPYLLQGTLGGVHDPCLTTSDHHLDSIQVWPSILAPLQWWWKGVKPFWRDICPICQWWWFLRRVGHDNQINSTCWVASVDGGCLKVEHLQSITMSHAINHLHCIPEGYILLTSI